MIILSSLAVGLCLIIITVSTACSPINVTVQLPATSQATTTTVTGATTVGSTVTVTPGANPTVVTGTASTVASVPPLTLTIPASTLASSTTTATVKPVITSTLPFSPEPTGGAPTLKVTAFEKIIDMDPVILGKGALLGETLSQPAGTWWKVIGGGARLVDVDGQKVNGFISEMWFDGFNWTVKAYTYTPAKLILQSVALWDPLDEWDVVFTKDRLPLGYAITGGGVKSTTTTDWVIRSSYPASLVTWTADMADGLTGAPKTLGTDFKVQVIGIKPRNGAPAPSVRITYSESVTAQFPVGNAGIADLGYGLVGGGALAANGTSGRPSVLNGISLDSTSSTIQSSGLLFSPAGYAPTIKDYGYLRTYAIGLSGLPKVEGGFYISFPYR